MTSAQPAPLGARLTIVLPVLLLIGVIAHGGFGVGRDTTPRIHSLRNAEACLECHRSYDDYRPLESMPLLCARCHALEELSSHPGHDGERADDSCTSCHDPHGKTREPFLLLRDAARTGSPGPRARGQ